MNMGCCHSQLPCDELPGYELLHDYFMVRFWCVVSANLAIIWCKANHKPFRKHVRIYSNGHRRLYLRFFNRADAVELLSTARMEGWTVESWQEVTYEPRPGPGELTPGSERSDTVKTEER